MDASIGLLQRDRAFACYWAGHSISSLGTQVSALALPLVTAVALHGSPRDVGFVAAAGMLPYLLFSLLAGHVLAGRPKRRVMIPADVAQAVLLGVIPVAWLAGVLTVPLVAAIAFLAGTAALCFGVVGFAYLPELVGHDDLPAANRALQGSRTTSEVLGPGLAGILVGTLGAPLAIAVDALSYLASAAGVALGRPRATRRAARNDESVPRVSDPAPPAGLTTGLRILFANPYLRALALHAALFNMAEEMFVLNLVQWAVQRQGVSPTAYGVAMSAAGVGALVGTLLALRWSGALGFGRAYLAALPLFCVLPLLATVWPLRGLALAALLAVLMVCSGVGLGCANVYSVTLRQAAIPADQLTRSAGAYTQLSYGAIALGGLAAGVLGQALGTRGAAFVAACLLTASMLPMFGRRIRTLRDPRAM